MQFLDDKKFWGIFERAQALDVPIYLHPAVPHSAVIEAYYEDYKPKGFPTGAVLWGFMAEIGLQAIRLIQSGVFEKYPTLRFILGHLGEVIPFMLWRCNWIYKNVVEQSGFARCVSRALLSHDQWKLLRFRVDLLPCGARPRQDYVCRGLAVQFELGGCHFLTTRP